MSAFGKLIWKELNATRIITATLGVILAIGGIDHGFFETLQGFKKTPGLIIQAIGPDHRMWLHGTEEALSIVPNFLISGMLAISVSILIMIWSVGFVHKKHGRTVFSLLFVSLFLFGGGIAAQIVLFPWILGYATKIDKPLTWWKKVLSSRIRPGLAKVWIYSLAGACVFFLISLEMAIFGYFPGIKDPEIMLYTCWSFLLAFLLLVNLTYVSGFAHDIERQGKWAESTKLPCRAGADSRRATT